MADDSKRVYEKKNRDKLLKSIVDFITSWSLSINLCSKQTLSLKNTAILTPRGFEGMEGPVFGCTVGCSQPCFSGIMALSFPIYLALHQHTQLLFLYELFSLHLCILESSQL